MQNILLVVGSPASGKSTVSRAIAERSAKGVHIPVDDLRTMVQGGVIHPLITFHHWRSRCLLDCIQPLSQAEARIPSNFRLKHRADNQLG